MTSKTEKWLMFKNFWHHRCTRVESPGERVAQILPKSLESHGFQQKLPRGPQFGFYCIFINTSFEICLRGSPMFTLPLPPSPPMCIYAGLFNSFGFDELSKPQNISISFIHTTKSLGSIFQKITKSLITINIRSKTCLILKLS